MAQKVVLAAICQRTDDRTHTTLVGQQTVAGMIGASIDTVRRAVGALERLGILSRAQRHRPNGARNSDAITVDVTYTAESQSGTEPRRQTANQAESSDLPDSVQPPTQQSAGGNGVNQIGQPEDQLDLLAVPAEPAVTFEDFYAIWPRKMKPADAARAWKSAIRREKPERILQVATEYANHPHRPSKQFVPYPASWLNADGWKNEMPEAPEPEQLKPWQQPVGRPPTRAEELAALEEAS